MRTPRHEATSGSQVEEAVATVATASSQAGSVPKTYGKRSAKVAKKKPGKAKARKRSSSKQDKPTTKPAELEPAARDSLASKLQANRKDFDMLERVASRFEKNQQAIEVCTVVRAVPTRFVQLDELTSVGGWPIERYALVHGPSNEGKTAFVIGLMESFLRRKHFALHIDAERTTPSTWLLQLMGDLARLPTFRALRPDTYESTVDAVREFCTVIGNAKAHGEIDQQTSGLVVIDSLRKLVPKKLLETLMKQGAEEHATEDGKKPRRGGPKGVDGYGGRAAQMKAALNAAWLDELVVLLEQTGTAAIAIAREAENPDANPFDRDDFKVGGGKAVFYDSSIVVRVLRAGWVRDTTADGEVIDVGEKHCVEVRKTKIGTKSERNPSGYFFTSNGQASAVGFDRARDVFDLGKRRGVIDGSGWYSFEGERIAQGEPKTLSRLREDVALCDAVEAKIRAGFAVDGVQS